MEIYSWAYLLGGDEFVVDFGGVTGIPPPAAKRPSGNLAKIKKKKDWVRENRFQMLNFQKNIEFL